MSQRACLRAVLGLVRGVQVSPNADEELARLRRELEDVEARLKATIPRVAGTLPGAGVRALHHDAFALVRHRAARWVGDRLATLLGVMLAAPARLLLTTTLQVIVTHT